MDLRRAIGRVALALVGVLLCMAPARARQDAVSSEYLGITAPPGCWTMRGGSPGRSGATRSPALTGPLARAWVFQGEGRYTGKLEGTPRVWGDRVAVAVRTRTDRVFVYMLDLNTGNELTPKLPFKSTRPLEMIFDGDGLFVLERRTGRKDKIEHTVTLWRMLRGRMRKRWKHQFDRPVYDMIKVRSYFIVLAGTHVTAFRPPEKEPLWSEAACYGELAGDLRGVWCLQVRAPKPGTGVFEPSATHLVRLAAGTGYASPDVYLGQDIAKGGARPFQITVLPGRVFVRSDRDVFPASTGVKRNTAKLRHDAIGTDDDIGLMQQLSRVVGVTGGWIVRETNREKVDELVFAYPHELQPGVDWRHTLADHTLHAEYMQSTVPFSSAGTTVYAGLDAFDAKSGEITRRSPIKSVMRAIPGRRTLLVSPDGKQLVAMRPTRILRAGGTHFHDAKGPRASESKGTALLSSEVVTGTFRLDNDHLIEMRGKKAEKHPLWDVSLALDADDRVIYAQALDDLPDDLRDYFRTEQLKALRKLLSEAYRAKAWRLMKNLIREVLARGEDDRKVSNLRKIAHDLEEQGVVARSDKVEPIQAAWTELDQSLRARIAKALQSAIEDTRPDVRDEALRVTLAHNPTHPGATAMVKARLPDWLRPKGTFNPSAWLELSEAFSHAPVSPVDSESTSFQLAALDLARRNWRKDLVGMETKQLLVLTPLSTPEHLTHCLSVGELVCQALETVFASGKSVRDDTFPLVLHLFENKEEYLAAAKRSGIKNMESTAGHYSPSAGLSRIFLPDHADAFDSVMRTYAHELTHHWISERCPLWSASERARGTGTPGYWVIEGFADFIESFVWHVGDRKWESLNPRAEGLDVVANAPRKALHSWDTLYRIAPAEFWRLDRTPSIQVHSHWHMGRTGKLSPTHLFYRQAAATVNYLYHTSPETRASLLAYVRAVYTGKLAPGDDGIEHYFGITPKQLGRAVEAYAKKVMSGWRPTK